MNLRWLLKKVAGHFGVDTESLVSGSKVPTIAKARAPEILQREEINGEWLECQ
jgi:hypothetical protein